MKKERAMQDIRIISLGGSIVAPESVDVPFIKLFCGFVEEWLAGDSGRKLVFIIGGGAPARIYQNAAREIDPALDTQTLDRIGIAATRLNAELVRSVFLGHCPDPVVTDPTGPVSLTGSILVAGGWKPGFSTDNVSVLLAEKLGAGTVYNLSNIAKVFTADPRKDPEAKPLDSINWKEYRKICGDEWTPGFSSPFDPVASKKGEQLGLKVYVASGRDIANLKDLFEGKPAVCTVITS
jgi:uridylate kinase